MIDPAIMARVRAALWCKAVQDQATVVAQARLELAISEGILDQLAATAEAAIREVRAIDTIREELR